MQAVIFLVPEPGISRLAVLFGGKNMVNHRAKNGQRRAADGTAIEVDTIRREQPLGAETSPVAQRIARKKIARRERNGLRTENLLGPLERYAQQCCCKRCALDEIASRKHKDPLCLAGRIMLLSTPILLLAQDRKSRSAEVWRSPRTVNGTKRSSRVICRCRWPRHPLTSYPLVFCRPCPSARRGTLW